MRPIITQIPNTEHYLYGAERELVMTENNLGMYIQLIDQSNIKLYDMVKKMGGTLLARKVDCVVVHYDKDVPTFEESDVWGGSRQCSIPKVTTPLFIYTPRSGCTARLCLEPPIFAG